MSEAPLSGVNVVEVALGVSIVGAGAVACLPGWLLAGLGARVTHVRSRSGPGLDGGVDAARIWNRGKRVVEVDHTDPDAAAQIAELVAGADVVVLSGPTELIEAHGLDYQRLCSANPRLVAVRIQPSEDARGPVADLDLFVAARTGLTTQLWGNRPGPVAVDPALPSTGAALAATLSVLAGLYEREATGAGLWAKTSMLDGMQALLPMIIGRVEHPSASISGQWIDARGARDLGMAFQCADGAYIQVWFGAKGAYEEFLAFLGDEPSEHGYRIDVASGDVKRRSINWARLFKSQDRNVWIARMGGHSFRGEPVLEAGEALLDPQTEATGLTEHFADRTLGQVAALKPVISISAGAATNGPVNAHAAHLLEGVRVLDLSAFLAGPVAPQILAALGAEVIKVEPRTGDVHRPVEFMFAAGQRGKRAIAIDLKSEGAPELMARLFRWSDVVHHNSRLGLAERLGYDETTARSANPDIVYSHASGFGQTGPKARLGANDHLMQALSGMEASQGGAGQPPTYVPWGCIDVTSGWVSACALVAALYARRRQGLSQSVDTSLLGASLMLKASAYVSNGRVHAGPRLDASQTGYGAAYRIYRAADQEWFALAILDAEDWQRLRQIVGSEELPAEPPPLRLDGSASQAEELVLESVFATARADEWIARLTAAGVPCEAVVQVDRKGFIDGLLDDSHRRDTVGVIESHWAERGVLEQPAFAATFGPTPRRAEAHGIPELDEHTVEILDMLNVSEPARESLRHRGALN